MIDLGRKGTYHGKQKPFTEEQIAYALEQAELGTGRLKRSVARWASTTPRFRCWRQNMAGWGRANWQDEGNWKRRTASSSGWWLISASTRSCWDVLSKSCESPSL